MSYIPPPDGWDDDEPETSPPTLEVDITQPEIVAVFYGLDGEPLIELTDRNTVEFGYQLPEVT